MAHNSRPGFLVLMATYNGASWVEDQIASILSQREVSVRLCISDDGSSDGTKEILKRLEAQNENLHVLRWDGCSGSAGQNFRNLICEVAVNGCDFIALSDQDDLWSEDKLHRAFVKLMASGCDGYSCAVEAFDEKGATWLLKQNKKITTADYLFEGAGQGCTFVVTHDFFMRVKRFCSDYEELVSGFHFHDWLIYLLARSLGREWYFDSRPYMKYRQHGTNEIGARRGVVTLISRVKLLRNGWYRGQIELAISIAQLASGGNDVVREFSELFKKKGIYRNLSVLMFLFKNGRRSWIDRIVLVVFVILGWL